MTDNILRDLNAKIEMLDRSVSEMRMQVNKESSEMNDIANQMATLKSKYDMKKLSVIINYQSKCLMSTIIICP